MADIEALMEMPWAKRAMDSNTPTLNIDEQEAHVQFEQADTRAMDANILKDEYNMNYITNRGNKRSSRS